MTAPKPHYHMMNDFKLIGAKYSSVRKRKATLGRLTETFREQKAERVFWG